MMKLVAFLCLALAIATHAQNAQNDTTSAAPPDTTTNTPTTTPTPTPTPTTSEPTTASEPTTQTDPPSPTTSASAPTEGPITSAAPTDAPSTASEEPPHTDNATTTAEPTPTTAGPTPAPTPSTGGTWMVNGTGSIPCIILQMNNTFTFNYTNNANQTVYKDVPLPSDAVASGSCGNVSEYITLTFYDDWTLRFNFVDENKVFESNQVIFSFNMTSALFPNISQVVTDTVTTNQTLFSASNGNSYQCVSSENITVSNANLVSMTLSDTRVQAYNTENTADFGTAQQCSKDGETSNVVPIAVGAALAALVVIVLIAYLISRNRANKGGYESV